MRNKKLIVSLIAFLLIGGFFILWKTGNRTSRPKEEAPAKNIALRVDAESIAKDFLSKQDFKGNYEPTPLSAEIYPEFWNVWFKTTDPKKKPNRGLVQINRQTGVAEWKELQ